MPVEVNLYQILIASPSDVAEERQIVVDEIHNWNAVHTKKRGIVLMPIMWEKNSAPEYNNPPQDVINRTLVDDCDMAVGVFWTRLGTPTANADSGTLEEIERIDEQGKLVMLYFSKKEIPYDDHDPVQLQQVKDFSKKAFKNGLSEKYSNSAEFREKFKNHLALQANDFESPTEVQAKQKLFTTVRNNGHTRHITVHQTTKETMADDRTNVCKMEILGHLLENEGPVNGTIDSMNNVFMKLSKGELQLYLDELAQDSLIQERYSHDGIYYRLKYTGRVLAVTKNSTSPA